MDIKPVRTEADYQAVLQEITVLMGAMTNTPDGDRLDILVTLTEAYEQKHYPMDLPDPVEAVRFYMEQKALTPQDLVPMIGRINRVYEILNRKRTLTLPMIRNLHTGLGIPLESLINQPNKHVAA